MAAGQHEAARAGDDRAALSGEPYFERNDVEHPCPAAFLSQNGSDLALGLVLQAL
jgi:hypothetical protein